MMYELELDDQKDKENSNGFISPVDQGSSI
jgi:hypothetical protein